MMRTGCTATMVVAQVAAILTVSYFVLIVNKKLDNKSKRLSAFGRAIAGLLWFTAALVLISGAYFLTIDKECSIRSKGSKQQKMVKDWKQHKEMMGKMHKDKMGK